MASKHDDKNIVTKLVNIISSVRFRVNKLVACLWFLYLPSGTPITFG